MSLKQCIRNRALSAMNPSKTYHIAYRNSKLTHILKDSFELSSRKHCKTVVFACVSPSVYDMAMTKNTLRYVAPIKIGAKERVKRKIDPENPADWTNEELKSWVTDYTKGKLDPQVFCPFESGKQIMSISELNFKRRIVQQGFSEL